VDLKHGIALAAVAALVACGAKTTNVAAPGGFAAPGKRTTGTKSGHFAITGPGRSGALRMYWPNGKDPSILDATWKPSAIRRVQ
jgi:hypothetical protein